MDAIHAKHHKLRNQAAKDFAKLNGWRLSDHNFSVTMLIRGDVAGPDDCWYCGPLGNSALFDHPLFFRQAQRLGRSVAIVSEPYNSAAELRKPTPVRFLPEQMA